MSEKSDILVIKSDKSELTRVSVFIRDLFIMWNVDLRFYNRIFLCLSEAIINSIEHGNNFDKNKVVTIKVDYSNGIFDIEVSDEGDGFNLMDIEDPTTGINLKKESGRGIHIIRSLTDDCRFSEKGNRIHLKIGCR